MSTPRLVSSAVLAALQLMLLLLLLPFVGGLLAVAGGGVHRLELLGLGGDVRGPPPAGAARRTWWWAPEPEAVDAVVGGGGEEGGRRRAYTTIRQALDNAPAQGKNPKRYVVLIKAGTYDESINITRRNVVLIGEGVGRTVITGNKSNATGTGMVATATIGALGHGFMAYNLTIRNTAGAGNRQAVALRSNSNKSVVYRCSIEGYEDTLYAENGLQIYLDTDISGTIDFVFGNARAVFQRVRLLVRTPPPGKHNVITAQGCDDSSRYSWAKWTPSSGARAVFQNCRVDADAGHRHNLTHVDTFLGRPHKKFSHVVFMDTFLGDILNATGWVPWAKDKVVEETTKSVSYTEFRNHGPGSDTSRRVKWTGFHAIRDVALVENYTADRFIAASQWVPAGIPYERGLAGGVVPAN